MNFCFVINDLLSASSQPGKNRRTKYYMDLYKENNIKVLVSLYKTIDIPEEHAGSFLTYYFKFDDIKSGGIQQLDEIVNIIIEHIKKDEPVNVNCEGGITESATVLTATLMKHLELSHKEAYEKVSEHRYAMEDEESEKLLMGYEEYLEQNREDIV